MRDPDALMEHEAKQQRIVEGIISALHEETSGNDNYVKVFRQLASDILIHLGISKQYRVATHSEELLTKIVFPPINSFTAGQEDSVEWHQLLLKVLDKVLDSIRARVTSDYHRREIECNF